MRIGMMWYDKRLTGNPEAAIKAAQAYYRAKYGNDPNLVCINPANDGDIDIDGITIEISRSVLPNNLWMGVEED